MFPASFTQDIVGSNPARSIKVLFLVGAIVRRMLCGQAKSLGRLMETYEGNNSVTVSGPMNNLCMRKTGFNSRYELRLITLSNYTAMVAEWLRQERNSLCGWYFSYKFFPDRLWTEDLRLQ